MKKLLIAFMALLIMPVALSAQNVMTARLKNGSTYDLFFKLNPVVTFTETNLTITLSTSDSYSFSLSEFEQFTFSTKDDSSPTPPPPPTPSDVEGIEEAARNAAIYFDEYDVTITGAKAEMAVSIFAADGKILNNYKTDKDGSLKFSVADLSQGTYIIKSEDITIKFLKK